MENLILSDPPRCLANVTLFGIQGWGEGRQEMLYHYLNPSRAAVRPCSKQQSSPRYVQPSLVCSKHKNGPFLANVAAGCDYSAA